MRDLRTIAVTALLVGGLTACGSSGSGAGEAAKPSASASPSAGSSGTAAPQPGASSPAAATAGATAGAGQVPAPTGAPKDVLLAAAGVMAKAGNAGLVLSTGGADTGSGALRWGGSAAADLTFKVDGQDARLRSAAGASFVGASPETSALAGGRHWMKVNAAAPANGAGLSAGGEDARTLAVLMKALDPAVPLAVGAASPGLAKVGVEQVNGAEAVHFHAAGVAQALVGAMAGLTEDQKGQALAELGKGGGALDLWINGRNELVQLRSADLTPARTGEMTVRYTELGKAPEVAAPPAADVFEVADLLKGFGG
ncbi:MULTISPECIES: hypothetical protein [unclassified Kitasatospora]|uniref:hypothetical protein n=1 Tax=unclassified Kitasatospora TaxID=2633591 RepID=UPI0007105884|nr:MULTISPECIES: hypothetical protein [unclassified Kitasatospora]KQV18524.1 hypothetical protein ASC99_04650 [Kitasatospora sp. Root107]KRB74507.1 hypothetical protein ASE03_18570 [Kitasatospora sp. Root187]